MVLFHQYYYRLLKGIIILNGLEEGLETPN